MKTIITSVLLFLSVTTLSQRFGYTITFEDTNQFYILKIDTISNPNNTWQIGPPQKSNFSNAFSFPNAIITDTINSYPDNDTSTFQIFHVAGAGFTIIHTVILSGFYRVDSDTLMDYGSIEFSPDNGDTWVNLITDTLYLNQFCYEWWSEKPILSGNSGDWKEFNVWLAGFTIPFNIQDGDTVIYRFSFISDGDQSFKDGLMFDNLHFEDWASGIEKFSHKEFYSTVYPNPTNEIANITFENPSNDNHEIIIFDTKGRMIKRWILSNTTSLKIDIKNSLKGTYFYRIINLSNKKVSSGKFIKN